MKTYKNLAKNEKLKIYRTMKTIRHFEETVEKLIKQDLIFGSVHFYIGQEAIAAGVCSCLKKQDYILTSHRCHGQCIAKGMDLKKMMAELMGKQTGYCSGKGGSMHLVDPGSGMMGANGIVGGGIAIATGMGYACKNFEDGKIVVSFFGDGAINTGSFHESLNLASVWKLPMIFVCENNQYAISMDVKRSTPIKDLSERAKSYGIDGYSIDGNDVFEVIGTTRECIESIKKGRGPSLVICNTYRQKGHSIHDPRIYRTKKEEDSWKKKDPIKKFEKILMAEDILDKGAVARIELEISEEMDSAVDFAKKSPKPRLEELYRGVYA